MNEKQEKKQIFKLSNKTQESVINAIDELKKYGRKLKKVKNDKVDNGTEFLDFKGVEKIKNRLGKDRTKAYQITHIYLVPEREAQTRTSTK